MCVCVCVRARMCVYRAVHSIAEPRYHLSLELDHRQLWATHHGAESSLWKNSIQLPALCTSEHLPPSTNFFLFLFLFFFFFGFVFVFETGFLCVVLAVLELALQPWLAWKSQRWTRMLGSKVCVTASSWEEAVSAERKCQGADSPQHRKLSTLEQKEGIWQLPPGIPSTHVTLGQELQEGTGLSPLCRNLVPRTAPVHSMHWMDKSGILKTPQLNNQNRVTF